MHYNANMGSPNEDLLARLGRRVRQARLGKGLNQRRLAQIAGLSPRFVSQLEAGRGNISILRLNDVARALGLPLHELVRSEETGPQMVALIGLRGAGKSTLGGRLAKRLQRELVELDALIENEAGLRLDEIFALHGERYYRRLEHEVLARLVAEAPSVILATGGSLVTERPTYELLKKSAVTIWLKAAPELHLERVAAQGDRRPMAGRADPLAELRALLREREPLYAEADVTVDTSGLTIEAVEEKLAHSLADGRAQLTA